MIPRRCVLKTLLSIAGITLILISTHLSPALAAGKKIKVATTFTIIADMAMNVAGNAAEIVSITKPGAEIHNYQPTPRDIQGTLDADLILWNGLNLELWFKRFLGNLRNVPNVIVTDGIVPMDIVQGPYSGKPNPHAWMSPENAKIYIENIRKALSDIDPDNAAIYAENAAAYIKRLDETTAPIRRALSSIPEEQRWLVTSEGAFSYLARDFGLNELFIWPTNADQQGTPHQIKDIIDAVRAHNIRAIFSESTIPPDAAQQVARETDAIYGGVLYVDSLSTQDGPVPTYLDLLRVTTQTIVDGLTEKAEEKSAQ